MRGCDAATRSAGFPGSVRSSDTTLAIPFQELLQRVEVGRHRKLDAGGCQRPHRRQQTQDAKIHGVGKPCPAARRLERVAHLCREGPELCLHLESARRLEDGHLSSANGTDVDRRPENWAGAILGPEGGGALDSINSARKARSWSLLGGVGVDNDAAAECGGVDELQVGCVDALDQPLTASGEDGEDPQVELVDEPVCDQRPVEFARAELQECSRRLAA